MGSDDEDIFGDTIHRTTFANSKNGSSTVTFISKGQRRVQQNKTRKANEAAETSKIKPQKEEKPSDQPGRRLLQSYGGLSQLKANTEKHLEREGLKGRTLKPYGGLEGASSSTDSIISSDKKRSLTVLELDDIANVGKGYGSEIKDRLQKKLRQHDCDDSAESNSIDLIAPVKKPAKLVCPRCGEPVSKKLLSLDNPNKIHRGHEKEAARKEWDELDIPKIDWKGLPTRCEKYYIYLEDITRGKEKSWFKDESFKLHKAGAHRSMKSKIESNFNWCLPGYYGPKGAEIMSELLTFDNTRFKRTFDEVKKRDKGLAQLIFSDYVTEILVPELATRLIMDDMKIPKAKIEKGRQFLKKTQKLGEDLNGHDVDLDNLTSKALLSKGVEWLDPSDDDKEEEEDEEEEEEQDNSDASDIDDDDLPSEIE